MKRFLAVLAAIGMVAGALFVRDRIDDDGGGGGGGGGGGRDGGRDTATLVCAPELRSACEATDVEVVVEDAAVTAERMLTAERTDFDAWLTPGPWPAMVDAQREAESRPPLFADGASPLASTRLAVVSPPDLPAGWRGVGEQVAGGEVRLGWRDPGSGFGVIQVAAFAAGFFGSTDFARNDFTSEFTQYVEAIEYAAEVAPSPLARRLQQGVSFAEAVLATEAEATVQLDGAAPGRRDELEPLYPEPVVAVEAVLVGGDDVAEDVRTALEDQGWDVPAAPSGLPSPGVLAALWQEVAR